VLLEAPFTCKIGDYGKSSLTVLLKDNIPYRFYNRNALSELYLKVNRYEPQVNCIEDYYVISMSSPEIYVYERHMGSPFYRSFDIYTLLISLLLNPIIYKTFFRDYVNIWNLLFFEDDRYIVHNRLRQESGTGSYSKVLPILRH
jgi:hypothetical protein